MSFLVLVVVLALFVSVALLVAQATPTYLEYLAIQKATVKSANQGGTVAQIRETFDRAAAIDDIHSITGGDLEISKNGDRVTVRFAYTREIHMFGPAYLVLKYAGDSSQTGG